MTASRSGSAMVAPALPGRRPLTTPSRTAPGIKAVSRRSQNRHECLWSAPRCGMTVESQEGRSSDGRHATQSGIRSALTSGPCSNSLDLIHGFQASSKHPMRRSPSPTGSPPARADQVPRGLAKTDPWTPWPQVPASETPTHNQSPESGADDTAMASLCRHPPASPITGPDRPFVESAHQRMNTIGPPFYHHLHVINHLINCFIVRPC